MSFPISVNTSDYCFTPLVCATEQGHMVVWGQGIETDAKVMMQTFCMREPLLDSPKILFDLPVSSQLAFLRRRNLNRYELCIDTGKDYYKLYTLDINGEIIEIENINTGDNILVNIDDEDEPFIYDYTHCTLQYTSYCYQDVHCVPVVITFSSGKWCAAWLNGDQQLQLAHCDNQFTVEQTINADHIFGCSIDTTENHLVICAHEKAKQRVRTVFVNVDPIHGNPWIMGDHYHKSEDYKGFDLSVAPMNKGFLLMGDSEHDSNIFTQPFTHLGGWLHPFSPLGEWNEGWGPVGLESGLSRIVVYVAQSDTNTTRIFGHWLDYSDMTISDW